MKATIIKLWTGSVLGALLLTAPFSQAEWINQNPNPPAGGDGMGNHLADGIAGTGFTLTAKAGHISTSEGGTVYVWGYANGTGVVQYPGPTLIVNQGDTVTVVLNNTLPFPVSMVFPGQSNVVANGGAAGALTQEATVGSSVTYTFRAMQPGTYLYHSGTRPDLQIEMGLLGAIIVRPTGFVKSNVSTWKAYATADSAFDQEYLFMLTEMDPDIHDAVEHQAWAYTGGVFNPTVDTTRRFANYWFINGRTSPDTMMMAGSVALPNQPYDAFPIMHPQQKMLVRMIGGTRDAHPFHTHANHVRVIARNGRLLQSSPGALSADLASLAFSMNTYPGETMDGIFTWTGQGLGWDMYGHTGTDALAYGEDPNDHLKPFPVILPTEADMDFGLWYGGSPFLGVSAALPPNLGGFDPTGGFLYMWHSHNEREIVNNNVFPGGMLTMLLIQPWAPGYAP